MNSVDNKFLRSPWVLMVIAVLSLWFSVAWGTTYYVSPAPAGNDANSGIQRSQPWATIQKAADSMVGGDTVIVTEGTYSDRVRTKADGSFGAPIYFRGEGLVQMNGFMIYHDYIVVDAFDIAGSPAPYYQGAIQIMKDSSHVQILNNKIQNLSANIHGIYIYPGGILPEQSADHVLIRGNIIQDNNYHGMTLHGVGQLVENNLLENMGGFDAMRIFGRDHIIRGNRFENISHVDGVGNHTDIFQSFGDNGHWGYNILIENNILMDSDSQIMMLSPDGVPEMRDWVFRNNVFCSISMPGFVNIPGVKFYNNTFYRCAYTHGNVIIYSANEPRSSAHDGACLNNVFLECGYPEDPQGSRGWYYAAPEVTGFLADYNYVVGAESDGFPSKAQFNEPHGINGGDPLFFVTNDFHLRAGSPAIDSGTTIPGMPNTDLAGKIREGLWDIGAFEFQPDYTGLEAPSNLRIIAGPN